MGTPERFMVARQLSRQDDEDGGRILEITAPPTFAHARRAPDDCHVTGVEGVVSPLGGPGSSKLKCLY